MGIHGKGSGDVSQVFVTLYTLSIYPSAHKELRRHLPNLFREFPCMYIVSSVYGTRLFTTNLHYSLSSVYYSRFWVGFTNPRNNKIFLFRFMFVL